MSDSEPTQTVDIIGPCRIRAELTDADLKTAQRDGVWPPGVLSDVTEWEPVGTSDEWDVVPEEADDGA